MEICSWGLAQWSLKKFNNGPKANKGPPKWSPYFMLENDSIMATLPPIAHAGSKKNNEHHNTTW
jgi:hypothetical protein